MGLASASPARRNLPPRDLPPARPSPCICCSVAYALSGVHDERYLAWAAAPVAEAKLPASIGQRLSAAELAALGQAGPTLPFANLTVGVRAPDGSIWAGSPQGLLYLCRRHTLARLPLAPLAAR